LRHLGKLDKRSEGWTNQRVTDQEMAELNKCYIKFKGKKLPPKKLAKVLTDVGASPLFSQRPKIWLWWTVFWVVKKGYTKDQVNQFFADTHDGAIKRARDRDRREHCLATESEMQKDEEKTIGRRTSKRRRSKGKEDAGEHV